MNGTKQVTPFRQRGLTLVELLIALAMGLALLAGVATLFLANKETYRVQEAVARAQETGRFTLALLTRDVQRAGFTGCDSLSPSVPPRNTLAGAFAAADSRWYGSAAYARPVEAFEVDLADDFSGTASGWAPALDRHFADSPAMTPQPTLGSDILLVRVPETSVYRVDPTNPPATPSAPITVMGGADLGVNDVALVSDCEYAALFRITAVTANGAKTTVTPNGDLGKKFPSAVTTAELRRYRTTAYFVAPSTSGTGPALWRWNGTKGNANDPTQVAEGVENLQVRFGIDDNADWTVDRYLRADELAEADWERIISAHLTVVVRSTDNGVAPERADYVVNGVKVTPPDAADRRLRQVFTGTVMMRNRAS